MAIRLLLLIAGVAAAVLQASFLSALPNPLAAVDLRLIIIVALVIAFRFGDAALVGAVSGLASDALSPLPFGVHLFVGLAAASTATFLFTHIFTNHSLPGVLGVNAAAYALSAAATGAASRAVAWFDGVRPSLLAVEADAFLAAAGGLAAHLAVVLVSLFAARRVRRLFSTFFLIR